MCFGFQRSNANGAEDVENGTSVPARRISSPLVPDASETLLEKPKKKKWNDDEYGDSVSLALAAKTRQRIKELYPDGIPPEDAEGIKRAQMSSSAPGGIGGGAGMAMGM